MSLTRLDEASYPLVRPLFEELRYNLVVDSILEGHTPAWVATDRTDQPAVALLWNRQDALLVAGDSSDPVMNRALNSLIRDQIALDARQRHIPQLSLHYAPAGWERAMDLVLAGFEPERAWRRTYRLQQLLVDWRSRLPTGCELWPLEAAILAGAVAEQGVEGRGLAHSEQVAGWVHSFWRSVDDYLHTGFGYVLLEGQAVASWCLSVYAGSGGSADADQFELGLATHPDYRGRGYATLVAAASVEHCLRRGWTPHWHCWEDNPASMAVAEKVGFDRPVSYPVYRFAL